MPTKLDVRRAQGNRSLLDVALEVHMATTGSLETTPEATALNVRLLEIALATWEPSLGDTEEFDGAVKRVLEVAVSEARMEAWVAEQV